MERTLNLLNLKAEYNAGYNEEDGLHEWLEIKTSASEESVFLSIEDAFHLYNYIKESFNF